MQPQIVSSYAGGQHNGDLNKTVSRLEEEAAYKDLSTIILIPAFGSIPTKAVASWMSMYSPPNQKVCRLFAIGMEVGDAYSRTIEMILAHPDLKDYKYLLTIEHDNIIPCDGHVQILKKMEANPQYAAISGLYYTKGHGGQPQIWGDPKQMPLNFRPQRPDVNGGLVECNGLGMGFCAFRLSMFKDEKLRRPWFKTTADTSNGVFTQDLYAWVDFQKHGYKAAVACDIKVGHYDVATDTVW